MRVAKLLSLLLLTAQSAALAAQPAMHLAPSADIRTQAWGSKKEKLEFLASLIKPGMSFEEAQRILPYWTPPRVNLYPAELGFKPNQSSFLQLNASNTLETYIEICGGTWMIIYPVDADYQIVIPESGPDSQHHIVNGTPMIYPRPIFWK